MEPAQPPSLWQPHHHWHYHASWKSRASFQTAVARAHATGASSPVAYVTRADKGRGLLSTTLRQPHGFRGITWSLVVTWATDINIDPTCGVAKEPDIAPDCSSGPEVMASGGNSGLSEKKAWQQGSPTSTWPQVRPRLRCPHGPCG